MNQSVIRWTKDDKANLRKAVNNFNSKIKRLEALGMENLPEKASYKELIGLGELNEYGFSNQIFSRRELNNVIKSLSRFSKRGAEEMVTLPSGEQMTKWEKQEIGYKKSRTLRRLNKELSEVSVSFGMGDTQSQMIKGTINTIKDIFNKKGTSLKQAIRTLDINASADLELRKARRWQENFMNSLKSLKNFDNYEILKSKIESYNNPIKLWEYISRSEILVDIFIWTDTDKIKNPNGHTYGGFTTDQDAFNTALEQLGLL